MDTQQRKEQYSGKVLAGATPASIDEVFASVHPLVYERHAGISPWKKTTHRLTMMSDYLWALDELIHGMVLEGDENGDHYDNIERLLNVDYGSSMIFTNIFGAIKQIGKSRVRIIDFDTVREDNTLIAKVCGYERK